ncbi:MAG: PilZ domain-containing protein [Planctomycetes bacterium]|nr:PilZ domain-containing protein [Planctomycetota bacterium]
MLEARYTPRAPRVHTAGGAVRRLALHGGADLDPTEDLLLDLGAGGMKLLTGRPIHAGDLLDVALSHPALRGAVTLAARVVWTRPSPTHPGYLEAGLTFDGLRDTTRVALEQVIGAELGSQVLCRGRGQVGWVAPGQDGATWFVYDLERREVARILADAGGFRAQRRVGRAEQWSRDLERLIDALAWTLEQPSELLETSPPVSGGGPGRAPRSGDSSRGPAAG